jgi:hypothetical protein
MPDPLLRPHLILPVGTQVVSRAEVRDSRGAVLCPAGAVGEVVSAPTDGTHSYRVRLPDGREVTLGRQGLAVRKHAHRELGEAAGAVLPEDELWQHVIFSSIVGSQAHGLADGGSDVDRRGMYLPPADLQWSLFGVPEQLENATAQETYWEIRKFLTMALKADPNVLECLFSPLVETRTPLVEELLAERSRFLSRLIYQTHNGYVLSQLNKLEQDVRTTGALKWKHAMHLIRLLLAGITALEEETIVVRVCDEHRERLLAIRRGEVPWAEVNAWRLDLHAQFDRAFRQTALPERPDYAWANDFLVRARRSAVP